MKSSDPKLHIGCFDRPVEGWHNTDITNHIWVAKVPGLAPVLAFFGKITPERLQQHRLGIFSRVSYMDINKRLPYGESDVAAIFASHMLEHLFREEAIKFLKECHRVLKPGAVLRISVPDAAYAIKEYWPDQADKLMAYFFEANAKNQSKDQHHWMYTGDTLRAVFIEAGFAPERVKVCKFREGACPDLEKLDNRPEHSLFVEGIK